MAAIVASDRRHVITVDITGALMNASSTACSIVLLAHNQYLGIFLQPDKEFHFEAWLERYAS